MLPDRVSNPGPLTYESGALPIALRGPAMSSRTSKQRWAKPELPEKTTRPSISRTSLSVLLEPKAVRGYMLMSQRSFPLDQGGPLAIGMFRYNAPIQAGI